MIMKGQDKAGGGGHVKAGGNIEVTGGTAARISENQAFVEGFKALKVEIEAGRVSDPADLQRRLDYFTKGYEKDGISDDYCRGAAAALREIKGPIVQQMPGALKEYEYLITKEELFTPSLPRSR